MNAMRTMRDPLENPIGAVLQAEILFNCKRIAPYVLLLLFSANAVLWWGRGPASYFGWATNSDFYIVRLFCGFSFMTMPIFIAVMMGDPVVRDFRVGIDPLILSKPISRLEYLLGKFLGNFLVLVLCQSGFAITLFLLQAFSTANMIVQPARITPYIKHFFFFVVITSLTLAAICFTVGTLTRSVKIVYGLITSFYLLFITWQITIKSLPWRWRILLDPMLFNVSDLYRYHYGEQLNQLTISYSIDMIINRLIMLMIAVFCLTILYRRFSNVEPVKQSGSNLWSTIDLKFTNSEVADNAVPAPTPLWRGVLPAVTVETSGLWAGWQQLRAIINTELRLLLTERSLILFLPLATLLSVLALIYFPVSANPSYSAVYAGRTIYSLQFFLLAIAIFYTGEALHRDRELKIEPLLWSMPISNSLLLLSKFFTTLILTITISLLVAVSSMVIQYYRGDGPIELLTYLQIDLVILLPGITFLIAFVMMLNLVLKDKYLAYIVGLGISGGLYYLYSQGYNHWLYNPLYYQLWTPADFTDSSLRWREILMERSYTMILTVICLAIAYRRFERRGN